MAKVKVGKVGSGKRLRGNRGVKVGIEEAAEFLGIVNALGSATGLTRLEREYGEPYGGVGSVGPYEWQVRFHNGGKLFPERMLMTCNRGGKSRCGGAETAMHLTGWYPKWWEGRRFSDAVDWLVMGQTSKQLRDVQQLELLGPMVGGGFEGTGWVPKEAIGEFNVSHCGITGVLDQIKIRHRRGGWSRVSFASYQQGREAVEGVSRHGAWMDEEPEDVAMCEGIYSEVQTRLLDKKGILYVTRTPLYGASSIVKHFQSGMPGTMVVSATWDDCPHLDEQEKARLIASYPEHERATRTKGIPMMGAGAVFPVSEESIVVEPFRIPEHWARVAGIDFGYTDPTAVVWLAHDRDSDVIYVVDEHSMAKDVPAVHASAIKARGGWIPVAWPHDGNRRASSGGPTMRDFYELNGVDMMGIPASMSDEQAASPPLEPALMMMLQRMVNGTWKVFSTCRQWLGEFRMYHRKDGIVARNQSDHLMDASRYAMMMVRHAMTETEAQRQTSYVTEAYDPFKVL